MSTLKQITDKQLIKQFELDSIPFNNLKLMRTNHIFNIYMPIISWFNNHEGFTANTSIYKKWEKISELLCFLPIYYPTYVHKNALWAFYWKTDIVLIYSDKRGLKVQVSPKFRKDEVEPFISHIKNVLTTPIKKITEL
jgi:hypothetical protein